MPARSQSGAGSSDSDEAEERRAALNRSSSDNLQVNLDNEDDDHEVDEGEYSISSVDDAELESAAKKARIVLSEYEKRRKSAPSTPTGTRHRRVAADPDRSGDGGSSGAAMRLRKRKATGSPDDRNVRRAGASTRSEGCRTPGRSSVDWDDDAEREIEERRERLEANQAEKMQRFKDLTQGLTDEEKAQMRPPSTRLPWTREELLALEEGVKKLGASWAKIRDTYPIFSQTGRSNIMLKDKTLFPTPKPASANSTSKTSYARISRLVSTIVHCMDTNVTPWKRSSTSSAYPSPSSPGGSPSNSRSANTPLPRPSAALYAFAHRLLSTSKLSLPVVMVAMRLLSRYYENARSAAGPPRWDIREMEDRALMQMMASGQSLTADPASTAEEQYQLQVLLLQFRKDQDLRRGGAAQHPLPTTIQPSAKNPFSLLLASLITANKFMDDARFSNKWWSRVSEMPLPTINAVESDFLHHLNFTLVVPQREYDHWVERMQRFARMIEEGERLNPNSELNTSPNVSPINPPLNPAWNPGSPAQQLRSPASPFINAGQQGAAGSQGGLRLSAVASPLNPTWISAAPPPHYAGSSAPSPMPMGMNGGGGMGIPSPMPMGGMSQQGLGGMPPPLIQQPPGGQQGYGLGGGGPMSLMELLERQEALSQMFDGGRADGGGGGADLGCVTLVPDTGGEGGGMMDTSG